MRNYFRPLACCVIVIPAMSILLNSCRLNKEASGVNLGPESRIDRLFIRFYDLKDTTLVLRKFRSKKLRIIDTVDHLRIVRMTFDTTSVAAGLIFLKLKKHKSIEQIEFDRIYGLDEEGK